MICVGNIPKSKKTIVTVLITEEMNCGYTAVEIIKEIADRCGSILWEGDRRKACTTIKTDETYNAIQIHNKLIKVTKQ